MLQLLGELHDVKVLGTYTDVTSMSDVIPFEISVCMSVVFINTDSGTWLSQCHERFAAFGGRRGGNQN